MDWCNVRWYEILIRSRIWIAFIVASNIAFFQWMYHGRFFADYLLLMFFGTLLVYNLHYFYRTIYPDKTNESTVDVGWWSKTWWIFVFIAGVIGMWYDFHFISKFNQWLFYGACLVAAVYLLPNRYFWQIKRIPFSKSLILSLCWLVLIAIIPSRSTELLPLHPGVILHYALVLLSMCIVFDIKDEATDREDGIITIAGYLGRNKTKCFVYWLLGLSLLPAVLIAVHDGWLVVPFLLISISAWWVVSRINEMTRPSYHFIFIDGVLGLYGWLVLPIMLLQGWSHHM